MAFIEDKEIISERYFEAINVAQIQLFGVIKENLEKVRPIFPLIEFILERLETTTTLANDNRVWDADIILRSALETFVKLIFITSADETEQEQRLDEYWNSLCEINLLKQSEQAKKNLIHLGHNELHKVAYSPLVLSEEKEKAIRAKWSKVKRQQLEQKWSFSEILISLSKNYRGKPLEIFVTLAHNYRMSSHVSHGDETGVLIIAERKGRTEEEKQIANFAHYLRILSDTLSYCSFVGMETMSFLNLNPKFFFENLKSLEDLEPLIQKYQDRGFADKDYDKFRTKQNMESAT